MVTPKSVTTTGCYPILSVSGKALARILLDRIRKKLLTQQRHEQSCFTSKTSTVDRILALRVLAERLRDFRIGLLAAYVDLRKAFDSANRDVLWRVLALRGILSKMAPIHGDTARHSVNQIIT